MKIKPIDATIEPTNKKGFLRENLYPLVWINIRRRRRRKRRMRTRRRKEDRREVLEREIV